ncbi:MAG: hypothetical protein U0531_12005 [Dehalococcoidia bacterium]
MYCQACGLLAPTARVDFYQNIGLVLLRLQKRITGDLCRSCATKYFREMTLITAGFGWWGIISFFFTLFILPNNVIRYIAARRALARGAAAVSAAATGERTAA